ncbi:MAG: homoserine dehydrogenase [Vicinamibacterales bacterium]
MTIELILVGFGNVARRFVRLLEERRARLGEECGLKWSVVGIATRRHGTLFDAGGLDVTQALEVVESGGTLGRLHRADEPSLDNAFDLIRRASGPMASRRPKVLVETSVLDIEAGQPAIEHVKAALKAGCHVVTANKGPVAFAYRELADLADRVGCSFLFEGAVMDGIPIFNLARETLPAATITGFRGIVNSTTHHMLTAMEAGREAEEALAEMQAAGIAEADASFDVEGWDAAVKTAAIINVLMKGRVTPREIDRRGIGSVTGDEVRQAVACGQRLRLVAGARVEDGRPSGYVRPELLPESDILARLTGAQNGLVLQTDLLGEIGIIELGSGLTQTAYALLSDLVTVRKRLWDSAA